MHQIYPDEGLVFQLQQIAAGSGSGLYFRLFSSNTTPSLNSVLADFTLVSDTWGEIQVDDSAYTLTQVAAHVGAIQAPNIVFTNTSGGSVNVYGYLILNPGKTKIVGAARFDSAPLVVANNGTVVVTPILGLYSGYSS